MRDAIDRIEALIHQEVGRNIDGLCYPRSAIVRPVDVRVRIGEPVETSGMSLDDRDELIAVVRQRIEALLQT